ncbi:MFS transporter [Actinobacteria bacterium YIM 96077]|uniref:MFS transporter n=1 Tax=Phytoactinopolyspora halophila TaxID=1981511 RepID=A0A329R2Y8_9ACTN|nr:MFS transporter [Actinobacteria bacterium YIM 96077]RAW18743.1 MFS transporter [Phytoactinopolyspora halophila]
MNTSGGAAAGVNRWWLVIAAGLVVFMATLDSTIVTVALPSIEDSFDTPTGSTGWVVLGYMVPLIALTIPSGRWLDTVGRRPAFILALVGFGVSSVLVAVAPSFAWLVVARVLQGGFGAVLFAIGPVVATMAVSDTARGRAMGLVSTVGPLGAVAGPALGGLLVEHLSWRWIFYVNVPIVVAVVAVAMVMMNHGGHLRWPDRTWAGEIALLGGASIVLLLAFSLGAETGFGWLALALVAVPLVMAWLRTPNSDAVVRLLRTRGVSAAHVALLTFAVASMAVLFLIPFYLQRELGVPPSQTGTTMLAMPLGTAALGLVGGWLADRYGARRTSFVGSIGMGTGLLLLAPLDAGWSTPEVAWRLAIIGIGSGLITGPLMTLAIGAAPRELLGTVSASMSTVRQLGFALGSAAAIVVWSLGGYGLSGMRAALGMAVLCALIAALALAVQGARRRSVSGAGQRRVPG